MCCVMLTSAIPVWMNSPICLQCLVFHCEASKASMFRSSRVSSFFFFFQAEDGIRDADVTGVQTCALPISVERLGLAGPHLVHDDEVRVIERGVDPAHGAGRQRAAVDPVRALQLEGRDERSEERRVGKECRSRWSPYH